MKSELRDVVVAAFLITVIVACAVSHYYSDHYNGNKPLVYAQAAAVKQP